MRNPYRLILNAYFRALARKRRRGESRDSYSSRSDGQALILILLVMSVSLLIGVGISFRATSTLRQISFSEQSVRAYSFAEAGAEEALKKLKDGTCPPPYTTVACNPSTTDWDGDGESDFVYWIEAIGGDPSDQVLTDFSPLERGESVEISLDGFPGGNRVHLYWVEDGSVEESKPAALVIHLVYLDGGVYKLKSYAFDMNAAFHNNKFDWPTSGDDQCFSTASKPDGIITYQYRCRLRVPNGSKALRITPLYNDDVPNTFALYASPGFPRQGAKIVSTGESGQAIRAVEVIRTDPILPGIFDFVYFSGSSL